VISILLCTSHKSVSLLALLISVFLFGITLVIDGALLILMLLNVLMIAYHSKEKPTTRAQRI